MECVASRRSWKGTDFAALYQNPVWPPLENPKESVKKILELITEFTICCMQGQYKNYISLYKKQKEN